MKKLAKLYKEKCINENYNTRMKLYKKYSTWKSLQKEEIT